MIAHFTALLTTFLAVVCVVVYAAPPIEPWELVAPKVEISDGNVNFTVQPSVSGRNYWLQCSDTMAGGTWTDVGVVRSGDGSNLVISSPYVAGVQRRFYRVALVEATPAPAGFSLISAGSFQMGDQSSPKVGYSDELPVRSIYVSTFYLAKYEVSKALWDDVATWAAANGYDINAASASGKGTNHPAYYVTWYECVKWCNARSQKEGLTPCYTVAGVTYKTGSSAPVCNWSANGYRLPTEAEWEKAARGGLSARNFPWGNTISHSQANYCVYSGNGTTNYYSYDVTPRPPGTVNYYYHPTYNDGVYSYTSPVGSFAPNGYGLYDVAGNLWEWCWDWYGTYPSSSQTEPHGAASGSFRVGRGGFWHGDADYSRVADRDGGYPSYDYDRVGFRLARSSVP